jgi:hypothetical protein
MRQLTSVLLLAGIAWSPAGDAPPAVPVAPPVAVFTATEFAFAGPDTLTSGPTTFRLESAGAELHHATLVHFEEGHSLEEFLLAMQSGPPPAWAHFMGGPNPPVPGGASETTVVLSPGSWAMLCLIPGTDGVPHVAKGMSKAFTVTPSSAPAGEPEAQVVMTMRDYAFDLSAPLTAGTQTIRVENTAGQPHEVFLIRLDSARTAQDVVDYVATMEAGTASGPPPGTPMGGVAGMMPGRRNWFTVTLEPGEYALLCFVPDMTDGRPHFLHGMMQQVTVQ